MARTTRINITKDPQCRHKDEFVSYTSEAAFGYTLWTAHCSNCSKASSAGYTEKENARDDLMRQIGDPAVIYE